MRRIILACALAGIFAMPAKADETLKWRHVQHPTSNQTQQVSDVNGHSINLYRIVGLAFFTDGSTGTTLSVGTNDVVAGVGGTTTGYFTLSFVDGSELWAKFTGTTKAGSQKNAEKGTAIVIGGKGRYAGAQGDGTWEGEVIREPDRISYIDCVFNIKK